LLLDAYYESPQISPIFYVGLTRSYVQFLELYFTISIPLASSNALLKVCVLLLHRIIDRDPIHANAKSSEFS